MKCEIEYATSCVITVNDRLGGSWQYGPVYHTLKDALRDCGFIIDEETTIWKREDIVSVYVTDTNTGELLAECAPEHWDDDEEPDCDDWDYNEDTGFDPYLGCYSDDC